MGTDDRRSRGRPDYSDDPETPTGIWVVGLLGLAGAALALLTGVTMVGTGDPSPLVGAGVIVLAMAQAVTMVALVALTPWALYATVLLYVGSAVLNAMQDQVVGTFLSLVIVGYVLLYRDLFRT